MPFENPIDAEARLKFEQSQPQQPEKQAPIKNARLLTKQEEDDVFGRKPVQLQSSVDDLSSTSPEYLAQQVQDKAQAAEESKGQWSNIGDMATHVVTRAVTEPLSALGSIFRQLSVPGEDAAPPLYKEVNDYNDNGTLTGSHSELSDYGKQVQDGKVKDPAANFVMGLDAYNNVTSDLDRKNPLPHTFLGNTVTGAISLAPQMAMAAAIPEEKLLGAAPSIEEGIGAMEGANVVKEVSTINKLKSAVWNPFTKVMATTGFLKGYEGGEQKGKSEGGAMLEGLKSGSEEAVNAGIMGLLGGVSGEYIAPKVYKSLVENGIVEGGKITQLGVHALTDAATFGAYPILSDVAQGKPVNWDSVESGMGLGIMFGGLKGLKNFKSWDEADEQLKNVWADRYAMATQNFMNASPNAINDVMTYGASDSDLFAKATETAAKAKVEIDPEKKKQFVAMASTLAKMSDIKGTVDAIVHDPEGFKDNISKSELTPDQKEALIQRVDEINNQYGKKAGKVQPKIAEPSVEPAPGEAPAPTVPNQPAVDSSQLDDLDNELDQFKNSQKSNEQTEPTPELPVKAPKADVAAETPAVNEPSNETSGDNQISKEEPTNAISKQSPGEVGVREPSAVGEGLGKANGSAEPSGESKPSEEVQSNVEEAPATVGRQPAGKYGVTEKPYYISLKDGTHEEVEGSPVKNEYGLDLFSHKNDSGFGVSEGSTGLSLGKGATADEAIANAKENLSKKTPEEVQAIINQKYEAGLKSPRGKIEPESENTDTENTEAVIAKATATVGKAKATARGSAKSAGIVDDIDKGLAEIDNEIANLKKQGVDVGRYSIATTEPTPETKTVTMGKTKYTHVGKNSDGVDLYESESGVRAKDEGNGIFSQEKMSIVPTREGVHAQKQPREADFKTTNEGEPEPAKEEPKADKEQSDRDKRREEREQKKAKVKGDLKDALKDFSDFARKAANALINPEYLAKGLKVMGLYAKAGILEFSDIAEDMADELGDSFRDVWDGLKAAYGAFRDAHATDEQADLMTESKEVRKYKIDDFLPKIEENGSTSGTTALEKGSPGVDEGKPAGGTAGVKQNKPVEEVPERQNGGSGEAGNEPAQKRDEPAGNRPASNGSDTGAGTAGAGRGRKQSYTGSGVSKNTEQRVVKPEDRNHVIEPGDTIVPSGAVAKFNANVDALFLLKKLEAENRNPTPAEKKALAQFVGWGGLAKYLSTPDYKDSQAVEAVVKGQKTSMYDNRYNRVNLDYTADGPLDLTKYNSMDELVNDVRKKLVNAGYSISPDAIRTPLLKSLLSNQEFQDAQNSTTTAYYTDKNVIQNVWDVVSKLGFNGGKVLEPSAGIGSFFGLIPKALQNKTMLQGYELDSVTGRILKKLYPQANITVGGFEHSRVPLNSVDLAISNVPFAAKAPYDKNFPELSKFSMHNYFIAKNLKLLKPGGIAAMITSSSTMDNAASAKFREWVTSPEGGNSYLVGAIRLPNNAFNENAGTQVTTDILIFQKKGQVVNSELEQPFRYTKFLKTGKDSSGKDVDLNINEYYIDHPEQMMGDMMTAHEAVSGGLYGGDNATLKAPEGFNMQKALTKAKEIFPENIVGNTTEAPEVKSEPITAIDKKEGSVFEKGGKIYRVDNGEGNPLSLDAKQTAVAKAYVDIKNGLLNLIQLEQSTVNAEANIDAQRKELNKDYDAFVKKHGNINGRTTQFLNDADIDFPIVSSLENIARSLDAKGRIVQEITKGEILNKRINFPRVEPAVATDLKDAINISLNFRTGLDLGYIARMLGKDTEAVKDELLKDQLAYQNPDTGILETPEEYLSGYVRDKLRKAEIAAVNDPAYKTNVTELKKVIPEDIPSSLISYSVGSSWIPGHIYEDFAKDIFGGAEIKVKYLDKAGKFLVSKGRGLYNAEVQNTYAASGVNGIDLLEDTLNNKQVIVNDTVLDENGNKKQVKSVEKTAAAQAMQATLQEAFQSYINGNEAAQQETERIYNDVFNGQVLRDYRIPQFKHYPGASTTVDLRQHQKRAVSRGLADSTLFAHEVGSGKTFTIITTAMEMRRLGTARKPLIGVQNSTLSDFISAFKKLYPSAKLLAPSEKEMESAGRKKLFAKIATGDWDAIILPHSQITMIPDDPERQKAYIREQIEEMKETIATIDDKRERSKMEAEVKKMQEEITKIDKPSSGKSEAKKIGEKSLKIEASLQKAFDRKVDNILNFEQLGIDAMLMDEAHKYKRLGFQTSMQNIKGIDTSKSQRSQSILLKSRWIQEKTGGKNVNFYTGTPISNTMAEAWTMMKYLRPDILQHMGIEYFDQFAKTFGQVIPSLEQTGGGTFKVQNRFAKFQNLPEFINAFRAVTDVVLTDDVKEFQNTDTIPKLKNGKFSQVILPQSPELKRQIKDFRDTLEWFDKLTGREKMENRHIPLVIYNKAKQASIDLRLLNPDNVDSPQSKVNQAVDLAYQKYKDTMSTKGVQMIFSDMYQSPEPKDRYLDDDGLIINPAYGKDRFNLFEDIKKKLIAKGVPADQIVIFTEPKYDKAERKKAVFADANAGKIRFMLGTTERMGVGVNAQQKMVALHHLDAPARPMDFEQRNGRIIRQGNENKEVEIYTYGVEKTLDSAAFQRLATKQKFINQVMKGQNLERVTEDPADEAQMTFDEMMAHLSDSPFAMQKLLVDNKLQSERMKQQNFNQKIIKTNSLLRSDESFLRADKAKIADEIKHAELARKTFPDGNISSLKVHDQPEVTEKFGEAANDYVNKLLDKFDNSPTHHAKGGFLLNGMRVELEVVDYEKLSKETSLVVHTPSLEYTIPDIGLIADRYGNKITITSNSGTGLLASIRSKLDDVLVKPSRTQEGILRYEKNIEQLKKDAAAKFDYTKMKELQQESEDLKAKMLAEKKPEPEPDGGGDGAQTPAEYIRDQSNIKPALEFLDSLKAKNNNQALGLIVPIPPAVWNGAIDVIKNVLKATNSTQKAIRVAGKYIVDRGGSVAQAEDFKQDMTEKLANTKSGQKAIVPDDENSSTEENLIKAATELQSKIKPSSPDEKTFAKLPLANLSKKQLHQYIETAAVMAADPDGVLSADIQKAISSVGKPPVPPTQPPVNTAASAPSGGSSKKFSKKNRLPMEEVQVPESESPDEPDDVKKNYSLWGKIKDVHVRNLEQLKMYGKDMTDMTAFRSMLHMAASKSEATVNIKLANDRIDKLIGQEGYQTLREALMESRLRGTRDRWNDYAQQIHELSDTDVDDYFEAGKSAPLYGLLKQLEGYDDDENPAQTILAMIDAGNYDDAREYMSEIFANAADNVAFFGKLSNGKTFDEMTKTDANGDMEFTEPKYNEALSQYKQYIEKPFRESHATNDGIFSDALGPLDTYYPLSPVGKDAHKVVMPAKTKYNEPANINNHFTKGSAELYSSEISALSKKLLASLKTNNKAAAIRALYDAGLIAHVSGDSQDKYISVNGVTYEATKVPIAHARTIISNNQVMHTPTRYVLVPNWLYKEIKPIVEGDVKDDEHYTALGHILNATVNFMLGGPAEAVGHSYRLLSGIINSMPYMQEWAYQNGVLGHAAGLVLNNPLVKIFGAVGKVLFTSPSSEDFANDVQQMASMGLIPEKTWTHTWSSEFAKSMGIEPTQFPLPWKDLKEGKFKQAFAKGKFLDFSPVLYGKNGIDLKARVAMFRLVRAMNPDATPEQYVKMLADLGQYTSSLQGKVEKFIKENGLAPFATFSRSYYRAGLKNIVGMTQMPLDNPFQKGGFDDPAKAAKFFYYKIAQMMTGGILGLVGLWMLMHKEVTGKWPYEDEHAKLLKVPIPAGWKKDEFIKKFYYNKRTGSWDDFSLGFGNVVADRGLKAVGAYKGYETAKLGGNKGQVAEAMELQMINTYLSQYTASPLVSIPFTGLTGDAPYLSRVHNFRGQVEPSFIRKAKTAPAGLQIPYNTAEGLFGVNPMFEMVNPISGALEDDYSQKDYEGGKFLKSIINIAAPNLMSPHGDDSKKEKSLKANAKAIETTIKKEHDKK